MSNKLLERRLNDFKRRCGKDGDAALQLAYHAAMPVALNPELLHFLRINFFLDPPEQLSYTVEFEFLTSGLCREIDADLYEIEPEIRNELLQELVKREDARQRIQDVATLLWQYVEQHSPWADRVELERAQQLTALNFLDPAKAQEWLDEAQANGSLGTGEREWFIAMRQEIEELPDLLTQDKPDPSQYPSQYKVFLCHNSIDKPEIRQIRDQLRQQGIETWMDEKDIMGFDDWKKKIKENLSQMNAIAVFLGSSGFGEWQKYEIKCTEEEISRRDNTLFTLRRETTPRVGLVILPSCQHTFQEIQNQYYHTPYGWLFNYHAVDLRTSKAPMQELIGAITGQLRNSNVDVDSLLSERGVNYTRLRNFLRAGQWKQADQETLAVMLKATGREEEGWLSTESIENFPCTDLRTIDQLWVKYSNGRFGFSVQKRIWESVGGKPDADIEIWEKFGDRVGWRRRKGSSLWLQKEWLEYSELTFTTEAPAGHLPLGVGIMGSSWRNGDGISSLTSRLIKCNL